MGHATAHQDAKNFTLAEKVAYDDAKRKEFAKENQGDIDKVKTEIKKEEDQGS